LRISHTGLACNGRRGGEKKKKGKKDGKGEKTMVSPFHANEPVRGDGTEEPFKGGKKRGGKIFPAVLIKLFYFASP